MRLNNLNVLCRQELLAMIPQPCLALIMLFPITKATEAARDKRASCCMPDSSAQRVGDNKIPLFVRTACVQLLLSEHVLS